jgi:hypothetical protein
MIRQCAFRTKSGEPCRAAPLRDGVFCIMHSPEHAQEIQEARRLGGLRRKRELTVTGAYEIESLNTVYGIRRLVEIAILDTLGMENSIARSRTIGYLAQVALRTLEVGELGDRIAILEQSVHPRDIPQTKPIFDVESSTIEKDSKEET